MKVKKLKLLRDANNLTQKQMASILNVTQKSISTYENGLTEPDISTMIKIADYFDVSLDYLLDRKTSKTENNKITIEIGSDELSALKRTVSRLDEQLNKEKYKEVMANNQNKKK
jgi:transcriptional regulator with XRE-family HTH domain